MKGGLSNRLTLFLSIVGLTFVYPIFTPLLLNPRSPFLPRSFDTPNRIWCLTLLLSSYPLAKLLFSSVWKRLARSAKLVHICATLGTSLGFFLSGLALTHTSFFGLIAARALTGACSGSASLLRPSVHTLASTSGIAFIVAIFYGASLSSITTALPFYILALLSLMLAPFPPHTAKPSKFKLHTSLIPLCLSLALFTLGWIASLQFLSTFLLEHFTHSKTTIVTTFLIGGVVWLLSYFLLLPRVKGQFLWHFSALILLMFAASASESYLHFLISFSLCSLVAPLVWTPLLQMLASHSIRLGQTASLFGTLLAPVLGGSLASFDSRYTYLLASTCFFLSLLTSKNYFNKKRGVLPK